MQRRSSGRTLTRSFLHCTFAALLVGGAFAVPACSGGKSGTDIVTRMNNAKGPAESFGFTAYGASSTGKVDDGKETKVALSLKEGCYLVFVFPGDGLKSVDLSLLDPAGKTVGQATKQEGHSSIKHCVPEQATYNLVV